MLKNNLWNRIFHKSKINKNKEQYTLYKKQHASGQKLLISIKNTKDLIHLLDLHKEAYKLGFINKNLSPDKYGMFRCKSIDTMTPHQVYLGGVWGLNTYAIPFWEQYVNEPYGVNGFGIDGNASIYAMVLNQYKNLLLSNIRAIYEESCTKIYSYEVCGY